MTNPTPIISGKLTKPQRKTGGAEVIKESPCPICGKGDWCYWLDDGVAINCKRADQAPDGWYKTPKQPSEGSIFRPSTEQWQKPIRPKQTRKWKYRDRNGAHALTVTRTDDGNGGKKVFRDPKGVKVEALVPYGWGAAKTALESGESAFIVEGESCVDALDSLGLPAISFCGGSSSPHYKACVGLLSPYAEQLVICPDCDQKGTQYAEEIAQSIGIKKWLYASPDSPAWRNPSGGMDVGDWIESGATADQIIGAVEGKRELHPKNEKSSKPSPDEITTELRRYLELEDPSEQWYAIHDLSRRTSHPVRDLKELANTLLNEPTGEDWVISATEFAQLDTGCDEFLMEGFLPANSVTLVGSPSGLGKSLLLYDWALSFASGTQWGGYQVPKVFNVLVIQTDESESNTQERWEINGLLEMDNVYLIRKFAPNNFSKLKRVVAELKIDVVILDSLTSVQMKSSISYKDPEYGKLIYDLKDLASEIKVTPIIVVHTNKSEKSDNLEKIAGSYAVVAAASEVFLLAKAKEGNQSLRVLNRLKSRKFPEDSNLLQLIPDDLSFSNLGVCDKDGNLSSVPPSTPGDGSATGWMPREMTARDKIRAFLVKNPGVRYHHIEISNELGISHHTVRRELNDMARRHIVKKAKLQHGDWAGKTGYHLPLPKIASTPTLDAEEVLRLVNLSSDAPERYNEQMSLMTTEQKESLYQQCPELRGGSDES